MGDVGGQVMTVNLHPESRNTILFKILDRRWETYRIAYIACSFLLILLLIAAIIYLLTRVVVPSDRCHFLEQKEAEELKQYLRWRTFGDVLLPLPSGDHDSFPPFLLKDHFIIFPNHPKPSHFRIFLPHAKQLHLIKTPLQKGSHKTAANKGQNQR
jgi:hypothetical protein